MQEEIAGLEELIRTSRLRSASWLEKEALSMPQLLSIVWQDWFLWRIRFNRVPVRTPG